MPDSGDRRWWQVSGAWLGIGTSPGSLLLGAMIAFRHGGAVPLLSIVLGFVLMFAVLWFQGHSLSNRPLLLLGVLTMLLGIQVLTTGLIGEMITYKSFRASESYSIKETLE